MRQFGWPGHSGFGRQQQEAQTDESGLPAYVADVHGGRCWV